MKSNIVVVISFLLTLILGACATIVGEKSQVVPISSSPSDASIMITDDHGTEVFKGNTPTSVTLQKSNGSYWGKKNYDVRITKVGYKTQDIKLTANANGWYIGGNIIFGGLIGWFIVDPFNGGMYTLSPENINSTLDSNQLSSWNKNDKGLHIALLQDVPKQYRDKLVRVN